MTPQERDKYLQSEEYKGDLRVVLIIIIILVIIAVAVVIMTSPNYTPAQVECLEVHKWDRYVCGV